MKNLFKFKRFLYETTLKKIELHSQNQKYKVIFAYVNIGLW